MPEDRWSLLGGAVLVTVVALAGCASDDGRPQQGGGAPAPTGTTTTQETTAPKKKAAEACQQPSECESNICFAGGNQAFCSVACTTANAATVCVAPFTGSCNKKGYCKRD